MFVCMISRLRHSKYSRLISLVMAARQTARQLGRFYISLRGSVRKILALTLTLTLTN